MTSGRKDKVPPVDARAYSELPPPPDDLGQWGQQEWFRSGRQLITAGRLNDACIGLFEAYCGRFDRLHEAAEIVAERGVISVNEKGAEYIQPAVGIENMALAAIERIGKSFGLTPLAETKLPAVKAVGDALDEFKGGT